MGTILQMNNNQNKSWLMSWKNQSKKMIKNSRSKIKKIKKKFRKKRKMKKKIKEKISKKIIQIIFTKKDRWNRCKLTNKDRRKKLKILKKNCQIQLLMNITKLLFKIIKKAEEQSIKTLTLLIKSIELIYFIKLNIFIY